MKALLVDVESTGLKDPDVVEYGCVPLGILSDHTIVMTGDMQVSRHKPSKPIEFGAIATHGILDEDLADCEPFSMDPYLLKAFDKYPYDPTRRA